MKAVLPSWSPSEAQCYRLSTSAFQPSAGPSGQDGETPVTYNVTLTIEVQADSANEAERLADIELPSHCDVNCAVVCHRIATSTARTREGLRG
jgi:hypothetical protein